MNRLSPEKAKAIAAEYLTNGLNKVDALKSLGYKPLYAERGGLRLFDNVCVKAEIARMQALTAIKSGITAEKIQLGLEALRLKAEAKGDLSTAARCYELLGKSIAMFTDNINQTDVVRQAELNAEQEAEVQRIATIRLAQMREAG
jgi:hypothetical protein